MEMTHLKSPKSSGTHMDKINVHLCSDSALIVNLITQRLQWCIENTALSLAPVLQNRSITFSLSMCHFPIKLGFILNLDCFIPDAL